MRYILALALFAALVPPDGLYREIAEARGSTLRLSPMLEAAAEHRALDMAQRGYFSHHSPDGETVFDLISGYRVAGEIIAWNTWPADQGAAEAVRQWLDSPSHRGVLLGDWTHIGVGVASAGDRTYFVAVFAVLDAPKPAPTLAPKPNPTVAPKPPAPVPAPKPAPRVPPVFPTITLPPTDMEG